MIELEIVKTLIELISTILPLKNFFSKSERRKEISGWLYELGNNIEEIAHHLENNQYPIKGCERMRETYNNLHLMIGDTITSKDEERIKNLIESCLNIEKVYYEYIKLNEPDKIDHVQELFSISGTILGLADTIKYQK